MNATCNQYSISKIVFEGNKKTRSNILEREIELKLQTNYDANVIDTIIEKSRQNLFNLSLFNLVTAEKTDTQNCAIALKFIFKERWYLWPSPHFDIIDRNFNIWWRDYNHDFERTIYGFHLDYFNATGNNDKLRLKALFGWKKNFLFEYQSPYLDKAKTLRIKPRIEYTNKRNLIFNSSQNKEQFYNSEKVIWEKFKTGITLSKRVGFDIFNSLELNYQNRKIDTIISTINPNYLGEGIINLSYFELFYKLQIKKTDVDYYPKKGNNFEFSFLQRGVGILYKNPQTRINANTTQFFDLSDKFSAIINARAQYNFNKDLPFIFREALGGGDNNLRGYELYLFQGLNSFMLRKALRYKLLDFKIKNKSEKFKQFKEAPIQMYLKAYNEYGKVWDNELAASNFLTNKWLNGYGIGIDIVSFYDLVLGLEYSFNNINENNIILQFNFNY